MAHYHVSEPWLNETDLKTLAEYSRIIAKMGGQRQFGIVVSEDDPNESVRIALPKSRKQLEKYIGFMIDKCRTGGIKMVGASFLNNGVEKLRIVLEI